MNAGQLLARTLSAFGVGAVYGTPLAGLEVVPVDSGVAALLARAHERVHGERAAAHLGDRELLVLSSPALDVPPARLVVDTAADIGRLGEQLLGGRGATVRLAMDLTRPAQMPPPFPAPAERWREPSPDELEQIRNAGTAAVLCGPGVVRDRAVWGLHELAAAGGLGVLNTWGAKGVFDWRSRHHWATVGLQQHDFVLGGLADVDLIVATGLDPLESPAKRWELSPHVSIDTQALARLAELWPLPRTAPRMPPLRDRLSRVTRAGWEDKRVPMMPSRITLGYSRCFGTRGMVAADPGTAGYWVVRTFATTELGSAHVPAEADSRGMAAACCLVARLRNPALAALAVVDAPLCAEGRAVLDAAAHLGVAVPVEVWDPDGDRIGPDEHLERLGRVAIGLEQGTFSVAADPRQIDQMIEVAGSIVAWT